MSKEMSKIIEPEGILLIQQSCAIKKGPPLLFIHGRHGCAYDWHQYLEFFSSSGFCSYAVSLRGHYGSKETDISKVKFSDFVEDIRACIEEIGQLPVLIGFSMGGRVAQKYVESCPAKGLVLLNSTEPKALMDKIPHEKVLQKIPSLVYPDKEGLKRSIGQNLPPSTINEIFSRMLPESGNVLREMFSGIEVIPDKIRLPVFVIDTDSKTKCTKLANFYRADSIYIEGIPHGGVIWGKRWKEIAEYILQWLIKRFSNEKNQ